jgi:hypothetical protein
MPEQISADQLSIVSVQKPSEDEVQAMNRRLENRRINEHESELAQRRASATTRYQPSEEQEIVYYPGSGYLPNQRGPYYGSIGSRPHSPSDDFGGRSHRPVYRLKPHSSKGGHASGHSSRQNAERADQ